MLLHRSRVALLLILLMQLIIGLAQQSCLSDGFPRSEQFDLNATLHYQEPDTSESVGYLFLVPEMRFDCHGYVRGWSAVTKLGSSPVAIQELEHEVTFQLWRPTLPGVYTFVGQQSLLFVGDLLRDGIVEVNGTQLFPLTPQEGERLYFQPGDVVGWYIHSKVQTIRPPLTVVYKDLADEGNTSADSSLRPVDMYFTELPEEIGRLIHPPPCTLSLHKDRFSCIPSVLPYLTVDYVIVDDTSSPASDLKCIIDGTTSESYTTETYSPTVGTSTTTSSASGGSDEIGIAVGVTLPLVCFVAAVICVVAVTCWWIRRKKRTSREKLIEVAPNIYEGVKQISEKVDDDCEDMACRIEGQNAPAKDTCATYVDIS